MNVTCLLLAASLVLNVSAQAKRDLVDLRQIGRIPSKGRVQDERLPVVERLITAGSPAECSGPCPS